MRPISMHDRPPTSYAGQRRPRHVATTRHEEARRRLVPLTLHAAYDNAHDLDIASEPAHLQTQSLTEGVDEALAP